MLADTVGDEPRPADDLEPPRPAAPELDDALRSARAGAARVALQLRAAAHAPTPPPALSRAGAASEPDELGALHPALRVDARRAELSDELEQVRNDAIRLMTAARAHAAAVAAAASEQALRALHQRPATEPPSSLRVEVEPPPEVAPERPPFPRFPAPTIAAPPAALPATSPAQTSAEEAPQRAGDTFVFVLPVAPGVAPGAGWPAAAPAGPFTVVPPAAPPADAVAARPRSRPTWNKLLYVDVVLPMIAVLVLLVVLLAWVG
ncbi:MAG: hypothetical protein Q8K58_00455 [Acidimicrobiales bacterium]|nr:hypothetical protein [Acidimicrobiales bacterium]